MIEKTIYISEDGKVFDTPEEALDHEEENLNKAALAFEKYKKSYNFTRLIEEYSLETYGIWEVLGEDPNPDLGGNHHQPFLGRFEGTLKKVIEHAVTLPGFWQWGSGGNIKASTGVIKLD